MQRLSASRRAFLQAATSSYHASLPGSPAAGLLEARGLLNTDVSPFRLGFVAEPLSGHEMYRGRLAIPYLRRFRDEWSVVSMRFRCVHIGKCECNAKYLSTPGDDIWIYNTPMLLKETATIAITEGELDAVSATISGVPAVGIPGAEAWQPYFAGLFAGYDTVHVLADGDNAGMRFATTVARDLSNAKIIQAADGEDTNSEMVSHGREYIMSRVRP
jgi:DNA primase